METQQWAVVTGASGGIGRDIARELAARGYNLILTARDEAKLQALATELTATHGVNALCMPVDLGATDGPERLVASIAAAGVSPSVLVNNAGYGVYGPLAQADVPQTQGMIDLNISALTRLTMRLLPDLLRNGRGHILNVASTAAFQPGPGMAVYFASKAYVLSFSEALDAELRPQGVRVTALCPGATLTDFGTRAKGERSALFRGRLATSEAVARFGVQAMERGQRVAVHGLYNRFLAISVKFTPRHLATALAGWKIRAV